MTLLLRFLFVGLVAGGLFLGARQGITCLGGQVKVEQSSQPIFWFVIPDTSCSTVATVDKDWFTITQKRMIPAVVLSRLRARDEVAVVPMDDRTDDADAWSRYLEPQQSYQGSTPQIETVRDGLWRLKMREPGQKGGTDFGGALRYITGNVHRVKADHTRQTPRFIACLFTDGYADGWQAINGGNPLPPEVEVYVWGMADRTMPVSLAKVLTDAGVESPRVSIIPFGDWQSAARTWGESYGRPQDQVLLDWLVSGQSLPQNGLLPGAGF